MRENELVVEVKPWYLSKTMLVNIATLAVGVLTTVLEITGVVDLGPYGPQITAAITSAIAVANIILRALTKSPLTV